MLDGSWKDRRHGGQPVVKSLLDPRDSRQITMGFLVVCSVNGVNYLIDGHHRWSKAYMINPDAKLFAYVIPSEGLFKDEDDVLKFAHGEIALYLGRNNDDNHPVNKKANKANDINIYDADDRTIKEMVMKYLTDEVVKIFANKKNILGGKTNRKQEIAEYIAGNKDVMVENAPKGEHSRVFMPQYPEDQGPGEAVGSLRESKIVKSALHWQRLLG